MRNQLQDVRYDESGSFDHPLVGYRVKHPGAYVSGRAVESHEPMGTWLFDFLFGAAFAEGTRCEIWPDPPRRGSTSFGAGPLSAGRNAKPDEKRHEALAGRNRSCSSTFYGVGSTWNPIRDIGEESDSTYFRPWLVRLVPGPGRGATAEGTRCEIWPDPPRRGSTPFPDAGASPLVGRLHCLQQWSGGETPPPGSTFHGRFGYWLPFHPVSAGRGSGEAGSGNCAVASRRPRNLTQGGLCWFDPSTLDFFGFRTSGARVSCSEERPCPRLYRRRKPIPFPVPRPAGAGTRPPRGGWETFYIYAATTPPRLRHSGHERSPATGACQTVLIDKLERTNTVGHGSLGGASLTARFRSLHGQEMKAQRALLKARCVHAA